GYLVVASTSLGEARLYEPTNLGLVDTFAGLSSPQSVAAGPDGKLYVGQSSVIRTVDLMTKQTADIGGGLVSGSLYGTTVFESKIYASGSGMASIKVLNLDGSDAGSVYIGNYSKLRTAACRPRVYLSLAAVTGSNRQHWSPGLVYDKAFGGGGLSSAFGVGVRSTGDVLIATQNNSAYYVFAQDGTYKKSVAVACPSQIRNIAVDCADSVYIGCYSANKVVRFDAADAYSTEVAVTSPAGVAILPALP
ncbi:MAG: hypothetical protein KC420_20030, partial [Myxococcales bacterium]|nr:hypothetical protein [Myxococcales bacterium]